MNPIAQQLTVWAATGIITALGGYMLGWWRGYRRKSDAMQTGVRVLLLCKLEQMQREMVANDASPTTPPNGPRSSSTTATTASAATGTAPKSTRTYRTRR